MNSINPHFFLLILIQVADSAAPLKKTEEAKENFIFLL